MVIIVEGDNEAIELAFQTVEHLQKQASRAANDLSQQSALYGQLYPQTPKKASQPFYRPFSILRR